ncbi:MAG: hypothetical protein M5U19_22205 [Microthrixaceae bacterium]|nr:hypothetical protein [Microthrixaceae bacterium]
MDPALMSGIDDGSRADGSRADGSRADSSRAQHPRVGSACGGGAASHAVGAPLVAGASPFGCRRGSGAPRHRCLVAPAPVRRGWSAERHLRGHPDAVGHVVHRTRPGDAVAAAQLALVVTGTVAVAMGRESGMWVLVATGAALLGVALVCLAGILLWVRRWSSTDRFHPAIDGYLVAVGWGLAGIVLGSLVAHGGELYTPRLIEAHLSVNVFGLVGVVILSTLPFFTATQLRMKMSPLATAARIRMVVAGASGAAAVVVLGELVDTRWLVSVGFPRGSSGRGRGDPAAAPPVAQAVRLGWSPVGGAARGLDMVDRRRGGAGR